MSGTTPSSGTPMSSFLKEGMVIADIDIYLRFLEGEN
jgi:hypothetical protein